MSQTEIGLVLALCFVLCAGAVLMLMAEIAREHPQGGAVAVRPLATTWTPPVARRRTRGRHRR